MALVTAPAPSDPTTGVAVVRRGWRRAGTLLWRGAGAAALVWVLVAGWPQLRLAALTLLDADLRLVAVAVVCELAALTLLSGVWRCGLRAAGATVRLRDAAGVALRAGAVSRLLPGGGAAAGLFAIQRLRRSGIADGPAVTGVALSSVTPLATLAVLVAAANVQGGGAVGWLVPAAGGLVLVAAAGALRSTAVRRRLDAGAVALRRRPRLRVWAEACAMLARQRPRRRDLVGTVACAAGAWACELAALAFAMAAVSAPVSLPAVALGLGAAHAAAAVPHTPGGVGVVEAAMTAAFAAVGVDAATALAGVLAYRLVGFWLPVGIGTGLLGLDILRRGDAPELHAGQAVR